MAELADARDLKSRGRKAVWVRSPPPAHLRSLLRRWWARRSFGPFASERELVVHQATRDLKAREVRRIYWELRWCGWFQLQPTAKLLRVNLVFHAFFKGPEARAWDTGRPQWPTESPERLTVTAQAFPLTAVK